LTPFLFLRALHPRYSPHMTNQVSHINTQYLRQATLKHMTMPFSVYVPSSDHSQNAKLVWLKIHFSQSGGKRIRNSYTSLTLHFTELIPHYETIILSTCNTLPLTLTSEHRLKVFGKRQLTRMFWASKQGRRTVRAKRKGMRRMLRASREGEGGCWELAEKGKEDVES
jgi:hypothetical protein